MVRAARQCGRVLKTGFNYRYMAHVRKAKELIDSQLLGPLYFLRVRFGHGGRPGYEKTWYTDAQLSGGGVLLEQGIHALDLVCFFLGQPAQILSQVERFFWSFPSVEDNCFCLAKTATGQIAQLHISWTQWVNIFRLEIFGRDGYLELEGRNGHYGPQRLVFGKRRGDHSRPSEERFDFGATDQSWELEWKEFLEAVRNPGGAAVCGLEGLRAQDLVDAAYRSSREGAWIEVSDPLLRLREDP